jgi:hypothetical protein
MLTKGQAIVLVSCVKSKRSSSSPAKDLYVSTLFRAQRTYAERFADKWFILSARYGLLEPNRVVETYEETLKGSSAERKRAWSRNVFAALEKQTTPEDIITITAGEDYCKYLVPLLEKRGNDVRRPVKGLSMGFIPGRLHDLVAKSEILPSKQHPTETRETPAPRLSSGKQQIDEFYALLLRLGRPRPLTDLQNIPRRGVYFFFEDNEVRPDGRTARVVRVGTHGLKLFSKSTLSGRLSQHRGTHRGTGNHRGSVFRLHVGKAIIARDSLTCPSWAKGSSGSQETVLAEEFLERAVSEYIARMRVVLLDVPDEPGPDSARSFIERNSIGLLAEKEPASRNWLGSYTGNAAITRSFLWNVNHVDHQVEQGFVDRFATLVCNQTL